MKPRKKSKTRPKKKPDKQDKQEDLEKEKREEEAKKEIIEEIIQTQFSAEEESELQLKWFSARKIPDETDEFILIVSRLEEKQSEKSELDQSYFVGYIRNARQFKRAVEIGGFFRIKNMKWSVQQKSFSLVVCPTRALWLVDMSFL